MFFGYWLRSNIWFHLLPNFTIVSQSLCYMGSYKLISKSDFSCRKLELTLMDNITEIYTTEIGVMRKCFLHMLDLESTSKVHAQIQREGGQEVLTPPPPPPP